MGVRAGCYSVEVFLNHNRKVPGSRRTRILLLAALAGSFCALAFGQPKADSASPLSLSEYTAEIGRWSSALQELRDHPEEAADLRSQLPTHWPVAAGGERIDVSTKWLQTGLDAVERDPNTASRLGAQLLAHLRALRNGAEELSTSPEIRDASARQKLQAILARREFSGVHGPTALDRLLNRVRAWVNRWIRRLSLRLSGRPVIADLAFWVLLICGAGVLLVWMLRALLKRPSAGPIRPRVAGGPDVRPARPNVRKAQQAAAAGDYREAIRLAYWTAIYHLDDLGVWTADHTRTHREYLALVRTDQPQRAPLAALTRQFERVWYAARPASQHDFESAMVLMEKLGCA